MGSKSGKDIASVLDNPENLEKAKAVFKGLDKNGDGSLDRTEWKAFANIVFAKQKKTDGGKSLRDSGLGNSSKSKSLDTDKYCDLLFDQADTNGDGVVSFEEFEKWLKEFRNTRLVVKDDLRASSSSGSASTISIAKSFKFTLLFIGNFGVGKTSLAKRFLLGTFTDEVDTQAMSVHCQSKTVTYGSTQFTLSFRDTCGSEKTNTHVTASAGSGAHLIFVCFDLTSRTSFDDTGITISQYKMLSPNALVYLVGTKSDLSADRHVSDQEASDFAASRKIGYFETSAKDNKNVDNMIKTACTSLEKEIDTGLDYEEESDDL